MDLVAIAQSIWRHKLATIPVILLTCLGVVYVGVLKPATYQADASYILLAPPAPPTSDQIAKQPALGHIDTSNAYLRFGDLSIVVDLLSQSLSTDAARQQLVSQGADPRFTVAPSVSYGTSAPIIQITGVGSSALAAIRSAQLVSRAASKTLYQLQRAQGTNPAYMIKTLVVSRPDRAQLQVSNKLRSVIAVLALGAILLFIVVSTMSGLMERWASRKVRPIAEAQDGPVALPNHGPAVRPQSTLPYGHSGDPESTTTRALTRA
jgi:hypothetical protein